MSPSLPHPAPLWMDLHPEHSPSWQLLGACAARRHGVTGMHCETPGPIALVPGWNQETMWSASWTEGQPPPGGLHRSWDMLLWTGTTPARAHATGDDAPPLMWRVTGLPETSDFRGLDALLELMMMRPGCRLSVTLHHELALLLATGWSRPAAVDELVSRVQAIPTTCLGLIELGGLQDWSVSPRTDLPRQADHRVPDDLWEALAALWHSGHVPALRLAWQRDVPPLAVMLDEVSRARRLMI